MTKINAKEAIEKIRKMLFTEGSSPADPEQEPQNPDPVSYTLKDGSTILLNGPLEPGTEVMVASTSGNQTAPDGELELADGTMITISAGLISEVETPEEEVAEQDGGETPDQGLFAAQKLLETKISGLEKEVSAFEQKFSKQRAAQEMLLDLVSQLAALPAESPAEKPKNLFSETKTRQEAQIKRLAESLQKMRTAGN